MKKKPEIGDIVWVYEWDINDFRMLFIDRIEYKEILDKTYIHLGRWPVIKRNYSVFETCMVVEDSLLQYIESLGSWSVYYRKIRK